MKKREEIDELLDEGSHQSIETTSNVEIQQENLDGPSRKVVKS
jgi:hypothetical protein